MKYVQAESDESNVQGGIRASASGTRRILPGDEQEPSTVEPPCPSAPTAPNHDVHSDWLERHEEELADLDGLEAWLEGKKKPRSA